MVKVIEGADGKYTVLREGGCDSYRVTPSPNFYGKNVGGMDMIKAFTMKLYEGQEQEYKRRHNLLWPEMKDMIHEYGRYHGNKSG